MKRVVVIGGGIIGLSSARCLREAGHAVTVIDREGFTDNCSYGNLGYVCPGHFIPLATPGVVAQGLKWMFNNRSPFYVQPALNASLIDWGMKFMRSATATNVEKAARPLRDIAVFSQQEYERWNAQPGFDMAYEHKGLLEIFQTDKGLQHAEHTVSKGLRLGLDVELLDAKGLQAKEPHTRINAAGAVFFKCDAHLYPNKLMDALKNHLRSANVTLITDEVTGFNKKQNTITGASGKKAVYDADEVVIATGSWTRALAATLDTKIPLMPGRGYSFTLTDPPFRLNHPAILVEGRVAITPMDGNKMRYGGTMELVDVKTPPRYHRVEGIVEAVRDFLPDSGVTMPPVEQIWYGFRPASADGLPYIGRIKKFSNVVVATGHAMLGLSLGAGTGKLVSEIVDREKTGIDLTAFCVERFG